MRIGFLAEQCLAPVPGGTGRYSRELAAALARSVPPGAQVLGRTAWHHDAAAAAIAGVAGPRRLPLGRRALVAAWDHGVGPRVPGDLVHAPTPLAPPRGRRPLVVTVNDAVPWTHPETLTPRGVAWHVRAVTRAAQEADLLVVPTHAVATALGGFLALDPARLQVVGEGVSADLALPADAGARARQLDLPDRFVLTVATLEPRKGLGRLLAALTQVPDVPLLVVGQQGWGGLDVLAEAGRLGLAPGRVRLLGRLPDADLATVLHHATVLAQPSLAEGFGLPVLEAMAAGTPVVTSADPALVEVGGGATVVASDGVEPLAAALAAVLADEPLREALSRRGRVRAAEFSWDRAAGQLWAAYARLLGAGPAGQA